MELSSIPKHALSFQISATILAKCNYKRYAEPQNVKFGPYICSLQTVTASNTTQRRKTREFPTITNTSTITLHFCHKSKA